MSSRIAGCAAVAIVTTLTASGAALAEAPGDAGDRARSELKSKKELRLIEKQSPGMDDSAKAAWQAELEKRIGEPPAEVINVFNTWTHETVVIEKDEQRRRGVRAARKRVASAGRAASEVVSWHLRCHFTNEPTRIDPRLFRVLVEAAQHFDSTRVEIISAFRAAKYNLILRKKGREVARNSQHTRGSAVDFRLPGIPTGRLRKWAQSLGLGGVGYYPSTGFIHVDVGPVRSWRGN